MEKQIELQMERNKHEWKAAGVEDLVPAVVAFVIIAVIGAVGALILTGFAANPLGNSYCSNILTNVIVNYGQTCTVATGNHMVLPQAYNMTQFGLSAIQTMGSFLPLLGLVIIASAIIGVVLLAFAFGRGRTERY